MKRYTVPSVLCALLLCDVAAGQIMIVRDWQFNTPEDTEGWTSSVPFSSDGVVIADAVGGSGESVLTSLPLRNTDMKVFFPSQAIELPANAIGWGELEFRIRQIGTDGVTPVPFVADSGTFAMGGSSIGGITPWPVLRWDTGGGDVTVSQVTQSDEWNIFTFDLSTYTTGTIKGGERIDPITGTDLGDSTFGGNFEIDYVTITAISAVPEPSSLAWIVGLSSLGALGLRRRRG